LCPQKFSFSVFVPNIYGNIVQTPQTVHRLRRATRFELSLVQIGRAMPACDS